MTENQDPTLTQPGESYQHRYICTQTAPWSPDKGRFAEHPDAVCTVRGDYVDYFGCPNCGKEWSEELPE